MTRAGFVAAVVAGVLAIGAPAAPRTYATPTSTSLAYAIAIQRDGKLVVAGRSVSVRGRWTFALARYTVRGHLDGSFGRRGTVRTDVGSQGDSLAFALGLQPDGKIVAAGESGGFGDPGSGGYGYPDFAIARYTARGTPDRHFGHAGQVVTKFGPPKGINAWAHALAIQGDGKVVVAGGRGKLIEGPWRFVLARYTTRGKLDPTFGRGGKVVGADGDARALAIQRDGKIVAAGGGFAVVRYTARGKLDPSFGAGGIVRTDFGQGGQALAIAIQTDGKIVVAGRATIATSDDFGLARYTTDGRLDPTFGQGGKVVTNFGFRTPLCEAPDCYSDDWASAVAVEPDGEIVAGGASDIRGQEDQRNGNRFDDFALARYTADGRLDTSFGNDGKVLTLFDGQSLVRGLAIQVDGKVVAAGGGAGSFDLARYTASGKLDRSFGASGQITTSFPSG